MLPHTLARSFLPLVGRRRCRSGLLPSRCRLYTSRHRRPSRRRPISWSHVAGQVSTSIVDLAFGPAGCPRSVEYVEGVFGFDRLRLNVHRLGRFSQNIIKERVPIFVHRDLVPCVSDDNDLLYAGSFLRGLVCDLFELDEVAPSSATVS